MRYANFYIRTTERILGKHTKTSVVGNFINSFLYDSEEYNSHIRCYYGKCKKRRYSLFSPQFIKEAGKDFEVFLAL